MLVGVVGPFLVEVVEQVGLMDLLPHEVEAHVLLGQLERDPPQPVLEVALSVGERGLLLGEASGERARRARVARAFVVQGRARDDRRRRV